MTPDELPILTTKSAYARAGRWKRSGVAVARPALKSGLQEAEFVATAFAVNGA